MGSKYLDVPDGLASASSLFGDSSVGTPPDDVSLLLSRSSSAAAFGCHSCSLSFLGSAFGKRTHPLSSIRSTQEKGNWSQYQMQNLSRILYFLNKKNTSMGMKLRSIQYRHTSETRQLDSTSPNSSFFPQQISITHPRKNRARKKYD